MKYSLTIFKNTFDNKTHRQMQFDDWQSFIRLLSDLSKVPRAGKQNAELISPAIYTEGATRSNKNVEYWGKWAAVDVDDYEVKGEDLESVITSLFHKYNFVCYSTASSTSVTPKFRLVFDLNRTVGKDEIRHFWYALNTELNDIGDKQTKDLSRMYYVPANYDGAYNFYFSNVGSSIDVDYLIAKHPYKQKTGNSFLDNLPESVREEVIKHRKESATNTDITWTSYRDCPFFPKKLEMEYKAISGTGWYHKMYQIMVAIAGNAVKRGYPITANEIAKLCKELDNDTGKWYDNRPLELEANSAIEYVYRN